MVSLIGGNEFVGGDVGDVGDVGNGFDLLGGVGGDLL